MAPAPRTTEQAVRIGYARTSTARQELASQLEALRRAECHKIIAAAKGNHGGRPKVIDDDTLTFALALKDKGVPVPDIAKKLTIKTGKNAGSSPSVASLYRAFAEAQAQAEQAAADGQPLRPEPARIR